jgi:peptidylprolyl isomerase
MGKKEAYKEKNLQYLQVLSTRADICSLPCGIFYEGHSLNITKSAN